MSYINMLKVKQEKQEESRNAALADDFIKEVDEYSSESEEDYQGRRRKNEKSSTLKSYETNEEAKKIESEGLTQEQ